MGFACISSRLLSFFLLCMIKYLDHFTKQKKKKKKKKKTSIKQKERRSVKNDHKVNPRG